MQEPSSFYEFIGIGELAETTTQLMALNLQYKTRIGSEQPVHVSQIEQLVLQQAMDYLSKVREGFTLSVRTSQLTQTGEIRYLLQRVMTDWAQLSRELGLEEGVSSAGATPAHPEQQIERVRHQLLAFGMAVIALSYLPRLPAKQITFPHSYSDPPTYADIPVPHTPGELLWRIEELERTIWRMMSDDVQELLQHRYGPLRRTYGFFEASAWLSHKETERFGIKKRPTKLALF